MRASTPALGPAVVMLLGACGGDEDLQVATAFPDAERLRLATGLAGRMAAP